MGFQSDAHHLLAMAEEFEEHLNEKITDIIDTKVLDITEEFGECQIEAAATLHTMWDIHQETGLPARMILATLLIPDDAEGEETRRLEILYTHDEEAVRAVDDGWEFIAHARDGEEIDGISLQDRLLTAFDVLCIYMVGEFHDDSHSIHHAADEFLEFIRLAYERLMTAVALDHTEVLGSDFQISSASCALAVYQVHVASGEDAATILGRLVESTLESDEDFEDPHRREFAEAVRLNLEINGEYVRNVVLAAYAAVHEYMNS